MEEKDCFIMETSVPPGSMRWGEIHTYTKKENIVRIIKYFLENENSISLSSFEELTFMLFWVKNGEIVKMLDLKDFIQVDIYAYGKHGVNTKMYASILEEISKIRFKAYSIEDLNNPQTKLLIQKTGFDLKAISLDVLIKDLDFLSPKHHIIFEWDAFLKKLNTMKIKNPLERGEYIEVLLNEEIDEKIGKQCYIRHAYELTIGTIDLENGESTFEEECDLVEE